MPSDNIWESEISIRDYENIVLPSICKIGKDYDISLTLCSDSSEQFFIEIEKVDATAPGYSTFEKILIRGVIAFWIVFTVIILKRKSEK